MYAAITDAIRCSGDEALTNELHNYLKNIVIDTATNIFRQSNNKKG